MCVRVTHGDTEPKTKNNTVVSCQTSTLIPIKHRVGGMLMAWSGWRN